MKQAIIQIVQGRLAYNGQLILENINLQINQGQCWAITGSSGSGKTMLLHTIAGKRTLSGGQINFNPGHLNPLQPALSTALVNLKHQFKDHTHTSSLYYQQRYNSTDTNATQTVSSYLNNISAEFPSTDTSYWTAEKVINQFQLYPLLSRSLLQLSNGETRRVLIGAALLKNPRVLLLDQPLAGLDAATRLLIRTLFNEITRSAITLVITSNAHDLPGAVTHILQLDNHIATVVPRNELQIKPSPVNPDYGLAAGQLFAAHFSDTTYQYLVNMHQVSIRYGGMAVLSNVSWQIKPGERWLLSGANGSGKSTLLSLISGDNPQAYANHITLFDRRRGSGESIWDIKKNIGFISPELYQYFPTDQSCLQVVESGYYDTMGLYRPAQSQKTSNALAWLKALGIANCAQKLFKFLPAGVQRLCLLARALVKCPPLLILDEPCQGLDDQQQLHFIHIIDSICSATNVSIIYVSHYDQEVPASIQCHLQLNDGCIAHISPSV